MFSPLRSPLMSVSRLLAGHPILLNRLSLIFALGMSVATMTSAQAQTFTVLYSFAGYPTDGGNPVAGLLMDSAGNLYGTTAYGGNTLCSGGSGTGCGTVFKLDTSGAESILHNFSGADGANPFSKLIVDADGALYGTTTAGGLLKHCTGFGSYPGCGVVFKLSGRNRDLVTSLHRRQRRRDPAGGSDHGRTRCPLRDCRFRREVQRWRGVQTGRQKGNRAQGLQGLSQRLSADRGLDHGCCGESLWHDR